MYFIETEKRRSLHAGLWGSAIMLFGSLVTLNYIEDNSRCNSLTFLILVFGTG
jgi:hypothetical protein